MRPKSEQKALPAGHRKANRRFTVDQRDSWVGSHMMAAEACGARVRGVRRRPPDGRSDGGVRRRARRRSPEFQEKYGLWLAMTVSAYAPFVELESGGLDWMEESSYG